MEGFSFSGLKTAVLLLIEKNRQTIESDPDVLAEIAWVVQDAIVDALGVKTVREVRQRGLPLVVCGGVSANQELRARLTAACREVYFPPMHHCVDNGAMIAYVAGRYLAHGIKPPKLDIFSRWPVESLSSFYGVADGA